MHQRATELGGPVAIARARPGGAFEHGRKGAEVGRHGQQLVHPVAERCDRGVADERHRTGERLQQGEAQGVHVAARLERLADGLLGRRVLRDIVAAVCRAAARLGEHLGETRVHHAQSTVVAEHERGRADVAVHKATPMQHVERLASVEADQDRLRRAEQATTIEHVAKAAAGELLADHVEHSVAIELGDAPGVGDGDVRMVQRTGQLHRGAEPLLHLGTGTDVRVDHLHDHGAAQLFVERLEEGTVARRSPARAEAIPTRHQPRRLGRRELRVISRHGGD